MLARRQKRRRFVMIFTVLLGVLWIGIVIASEKAFGGNGIWVFGETYDAGAISPGSGLSHRAWLINPTTSNYSVRAEATCGCVLSNFNATTIAPLSMLPIDISVDTNGKRAGAYHEKVSLILRSNNNSWTENISVRFEVK